MTRSYKTDERAARAWAKANGVVGRQGGWLYRNDKPYCQGYASLAWDLRRREILVQADDRKWRIAEAAK